MSVSDRKLKITWSKHHHNFVLWSLIEILLVQSTIPFDSNFSDWIFQGPRCNSLELWCLSLLRHKLLNTFLFQDRLCFLSSCFPPFFHEQFFYVLICFSESVSELSPETRQTLSLFSELTDTKTQVSYRPWHQKNAVLSKPTASFSGTVMSILKPVMECDITTNLSSYTSGTFRT